MSKSDEDDGAAREMGPSRDEEVGNSGGGASSATDKVTRGTGDRAPGAAHDSRGPSRDGEVGSGGGGNPPATDPPARGGG
jgi:hypothetical protein